MPSFQNKKKKTLFLKLFILSLIGVIVTLVLVFGWRIYEKNMNLPIGIEDGDDIWKVPIEDRDFLSIFHVVLKDEKVSWLNNESDETKELTELDVSKYEDLAWFIFNHSHGSLTSLKLPIGGEKLTRINVSGNQLSDLSIFSHLVNLKELILDNNNFSGSLRPLRKLTKLQKLSIFKTNLNEGLEYLPFSVETFIFNRYKSGGFLRSGCESEFAKLLGISWDIEVIKYWDLVKKSSVVYEKEQLDEWRGINFQLILNAKKRAKFEKLLAQLKLALQGWIPKDERKKNFFQIFIEHILPERISSLKKGNW